MFREAKIKNVLDKRRNGMDTFIVGAIVLLIVGAAVFYIVKAKKKGVKCIGCPQGSACADGCGECGAACHTQNGK